MTHDHDEGRLTRATCPECTYKDGYIRGRHEKEALVTVASVLDAMEEGAGEFAVAAILVLALRFVAGWVELAALEFGSGLVFVGVAAAAATGWSLRLWRWARRGQSINRRGVEGGETRERVGAGRGKVAESRQP